MIKGTCLRSGHNTLNNLIFTKPVVSCCLLVYGIAVLWYLNMSSIDLAIRFKIGMYLLNRESVKGTTIQTAMPFDDKLKSAFALQLEEHIILVKLSF